VPRRRNASMRHAPKGLPSLGAVAGRTGLSTRRSAHFLECIYCVLFNNF
jgi:hypothetical protein